MTAGPDAFDDATPAALAASRPGDAALVARTGARLGWRSGEGARLYALGLLTAVALFYQLDRSAMFITQELVKHQYRLSDTELGVLTGAAYGLANGLAAIPLGWLVDRVSRKRLLGVIVALWSAATALCGLSGGYLQMLLARIGVGATEAGGTPTSMSILTDLYPPERRALAVGVVFSGFSMGSIIAGFAGGYLAARFGWRSVFLAYGLPGLGLGLLILATLREPVRARSGAEPVTGLRSTPAALGSLLTQPALGMIYAAVALTSLIINGVFTWWASFMIRIHHFSLPTVGLAMAIGPGLFGMIGVVLTGWLADLARRRGRGGALYVACGATLINLAAGTVAIWCASKALMLVALCLAWGAAGAYSGPTNTVISEIAPSNLRGLAFSISVVATNLVGAALGPVIIGAVSDFVRTQLPGLQPLRVAMFAVLLAQLPVSFLYARAGRRLNGRT